MEICVLKYFLTVAKRTEYYQSSRNAAHDSANAFKTARSP